MLTESEVDLPVRVILKVVNDDRWDTPPIADEGSTLRIRPAQWIAVVAAIGILVGLSVLGVASLQGAPGLDPAGHGSNDSTSSGLFGVTDEKLGQLVEASVEWHAPQSMKVDRVERIGLSIGDSRRLQFQIDSLIRDALPRSAGKVRIGPKIRVTLQADPGDATIQPSKAVDQSTGSQIAMLWTWLVRPKHPAADGIRFTARIEVPSDKYTFVTDIPVQLKVDRTWNFTLKQIFTHWATWSAIAVATASALRWLYERRKRRPVGFRVGD